MATICWLRKTRSWCEIVVSSRPRPVAKSPTHNSPDGARRRAYTTCRRVGSLRTAKSEAMPIAESVVNRFLLTASICSVWIERSLYALPEAASCEFAADGVRYIASTDCDTMQSILVSNEYLYNYAAILYVLYHI